MIIFGTIYAYVVTDVSKNDILFLLCYICGYTLAINILSCSAVNFVWSNKTNRSSATIYRDYKPQLHEYTSITIDRQGVVDIRDGEGV